MTKIKQKEKSFTILYHLYVLYKILSKLSNNTNIVVDFAQKCYLPDENGGCVERTGRKKLIGCGVVEVLL